MKIKAVGFDIDGTLYPNLSMYIHTSSSFILHPRLVYHFGKVRKEIRRTEYTGDFRMVQAKLLAYSMGISKEKAAEITERYLYQAWEHSFKGLKPFPDVRPVIQSLRNAGIRTGALSDFPVRKKLDFLGLADLMDCALSSEDSGYLKPHPVPFRQLISSFGCRPEEILYVGNSYKYDILGASGAGMKTAHLTRKAEPDSVADLSFYSYPVLRDWILSFNN